MIEIREPRNENSKTLKIQEKSPKICSIGTYSSVNRVQQETRKSKDKLSGLIDEINRKKLYQLARCSMQDPSMDTEMEQDVAVKQTKAVASSIAQIFEIKVARSLRQVNIVGQLNHSASKGLLLVILTCFVLSLSHIDTKLVDALSWPHGNNGNNRAPILSNHIDAPTGKIESVFQRNKRSSRGISTMNPISVNPASLKNPSGGPILSQQFHYFWNHDQIEPKTLESEARSVLLEAQRQTDDLAINPRLAMDVTSGSTISSRQDSDHLKATRLARESRSDGTSDPLEASNSQAFPFTIPPAIEQHLTSLVLQMQKQQRMSMMMQPRFFPAASIRRFSSSPLNFINPYWMSGSSQHTVIAPPPPTPLIPSSSRPLFSASEPMASLAPNHQAGLSEPSLLSQASMAAMAGVPIHGPFMIGPSPFAMQAAAQRQMMLSTPPSNNQLQSLSSKSAGSQPTASHGSGRFTPSFLKSRKSRPFFSFSQLPAVSSGRSSMIQSASQVLPTLALPPPPTITTSRDSATILDAASNQLINALASQIQQKLADTLVQLAIQRDQQQIISSPNVQTSISDKLQSGSSITPTQGVGLQIGQKPINLQAPYQVTTSGLLGSAQLALNQLLALSQQQANSIPQVPLEFTNLTAIPFGQRFKRRHLNMSTPILAPVASKRPQLAKNISNQDPIRQIVEDFPLDGLVFAPIGLGTDSFMTSPEDADNDGFFLSQRLSPKTNIGGAIAKGDPISMSDQSGEDTEQQTQLRRLKRSVLLSSSGGAKPKSSGVGWLPMTVEGQISSKKILNNTIDFESRKIDAIDDSNKLTTYESNRTRSREAKSLFNDSPKLLPNGGMTAPNGGTGVTRRLADLSGSTQSNVRMQQEGKELDSTNHDAGWAQNSPRDKLKGRRSNTGATITYNAPVKARFLGKDSVSSLKRGLVSVGSPNSFAQEPQATGKPSVELVNKQQDPMVASISESTRIANYFQNVEGEVKQQPRPSKPNSQPSSSPSTQQILGAENLSSPMTHEIPTGSSSYTRQSTHVDPDQVSVGFPSPNHITNSNKQQTDSSNGQNSVQNEAQAQAPSYSDNSGMNQNQASRLLGQMSNHQGLSSSLAHTNNGDISPAATGTQNHLAQPSGSVIAGIPSHQKYRSFSQNYLTAANFANLRNLISSNINQRSSSPSATVVAPMSLLGSGKLGIGSKLQTTDDRSTSADQSNSYNEEMIPPNQQFSSGVSSAQGTGSGAEMSSNSANSNMMLNSGPYGSEQQISDLSNPSSGTQTLVQTDSGEQTVSSQAFNPEINGGSSGATSSSSFSTPSDSGSSQYDLSNTNFELLKTRLSNQALSQQQTPSLFPSAQYLQQNQSVQPTYIHEEAPDTTTLVSGQQDSLNGAQSPQTQSLGYQALTNEGGIQQQQQVQQQQQPQQVQLIATQSGQQAIMSPQQAAMAISAYNQQQQQQQLQNTINRQFQESLRQFNQINGISSSGLPISRLAISGSSQRAPLTNLYQPQLYGLVDEETAARAEAAAGISSFPSEARLVALQSQQDRMTDLMNGALQMSGTEHREANELSEAPNEGKSKGSKGKKGKKGKSQPVSHHYHFNSFGSPFEDTENQFINNPFDVAIAQQNQSAKSNGSKGHKSKGQKDGDSEDDKNDQQVEEEKPKKKGFLRRFSIKNLFKRFRKEKKKEEPEQSSEESSSNTENGSNNSEK